MPDVGGLVQKNQANVTNGRHIHNYSTFDRSLSYRLYNTLRFGDYTPSFNMEGVPNDEIQLNSLDRIDSLSLNAPFKGSIRKIKESFMVPNLAILPMQWDRIYAQNSNGDDVPDDANCFLENFPAYFTEFWLGLRTLLKNNIPSADSSEGFTITAAYLTALIRTLVCGEYIYSSGSLLNVCGYKANGWIRFNVPPSANVDQFYSYDAWFDKVLSDVFSQINSMIVNEPVGSSQRQHLFYGLADNASLWGREAESFRALLELFRENPLCTIDIVRPSDIQTGVDFTALIADFSVDPYTYLPDSNSAEFTDDLTDLNPTTLNLSRLLAYQLVCAHFYSNSSIDFIYSAELYRQYIHSLYLLIHPAWLANNDVFNFNWNGMTLQYDDLSGHMLQLSLYLSGYSTVKTFTYAQLSGPNSIPGQYDSIGRFAIFSAVFGFRKSLRYGDYFTASRPRPLAPVNTDVAVNNNMVSVVDITRNIQAQRFANSVMRSRSKIEEYVKSLFGRAPQPDYHNPFFLTRSEEMIFGDEVQNTAESQITNPNSRTANFAGNVSPYTFTFHNDDMHPCVYIQIISFDIKRAYTRTVERQFLHRNRFDMFNPDFQYIGDQPIYGIELGYVDTSDKIPEVFSYTTRDMEYKQRFDQAAGGFVENLPGWCLTDQDRSRVNPSNLDPDFIRSYNTELDQFFLSLTGFSLGSYFHFTCITDNNVNAKRAMAVDPQILA